MWIISETLVGTLISSAVTLDGLRIEGWDADGSTCSSQGASLDKCHEIPRLRLQMTCS
jgi:hypothetical protein